MTSSTRSTFFAVGAAAIVILALITWAVRSSWLSSHHLQALNIQLAAQADDLPDDAQVLLSRMNSLLLESVFGPAQDESLSAEFEALARELRERLVSETFAVQDARQLERAGRIADGLEAYFEAAQSLMHEGFEGRDQTSRFRRAQAVREQGELLLLDLDRVSQTLDQELEETFRSYHSAYSRLAFLLILLPALCIALAGATIFVALQNHLATLRLDLSRTKLAHAQQEKLASLGTLASGVAHEIRNPLTAIKTRLFALNRKVGSNPDARTQIAEIGNEINRLDRIVKEFLLFARPPKPAVQSIDVPVLLRDVGELLRKELENKGIGIEIPTTEPLTTKGDAEQITQILINLIQNAADASRPGDSVTVTAKPFAGASRQSAGQQIAINVVDRGAGVPEAHASKLFNPFYTAKANGVGLGLSIAKRIAQIHGGDIVFESTEGAGTTFTLILPAGGSASDKRISS